MLEMVALLNKSKDRQYQTISHVKILNNNIFVTSNVKSSLLVIYSYNVFKGNGKSPLHISHLILKLYVFIPFNANYFPHY